MTSPRATHAPSNWGVLHRLPLRANFWSLVLALLTLIVGTAAEIGMAMLMRSIVDQSFSTQVAAPTSRHFLLLILAIVVLALTAFGRVIATNWIGERIARDVRRQVFDHAIRLGPEFHEKTNTGDVLARLAGDVTIVQEFIANSLPAAIRGTFMIIGGLIAMLTISPRLFLWLIGLVPLLAIPFWIGGSVVRRRAREHQDQVRNTVQFAEEMLNGYQTVQAFTYEPEATRKYAEHLDVAVQSAQRRSWAFALLQGAVVIITFGMIDLLLFVGAMEVARGTMSGGDMTAFVFLSMLVAAGFSSASHVWGEYSRACGSADRLAELLATKNSIQSPDDCEPLPLPVRGSVEFRGVTFCYPSRPDEPALDGFQLEVFPGETVALVGPSGAGKSSVFKLLTRMYDASAGTILIDGVDIRRLKLDTLRTVIATVPQEVELFTGTAWDNIRLGLCAATDDQIRAAASAAAVSEFTAGSAAGPLLMARGRNLSGGQRQRLAIARALLRQAPILLFDEATASLDGASETRIRDALDAIAWRCTVIIIAHRLATVRHADRIAVVNHGKIVAIGTHDDLLTRCELYAELARSQVVDTDHDRVAASESKCSE